MILRAPTCFRSFLHRGSRAARTCPAACSLGWSCLCSEIAAEDQETEESSFLGYYQTSPSPSGSPQGSWDCCCQRWGSPTSVDVREAIKKNHQICRRARALSDAGNSHVHEVSRDLRGSHLTLRRVGHAPHCCHHRERTWWLIVALLPGNRVVGKRPISGGDREKHVMYRYAQIFTMHKKNSQNICLG